MEITRRFLAAFIADSVSNMNQAGFEPKLLHTVSLHAQPMHRSTGRLRRFNELINYFPVSWAAAEQSSYELSECLHGLTRFSNIPVYKYTLRSAQFQLASTSNNLFSLGNFLIMRNTSMVFRPRSLKSNDMIDLKSAEWRRGLNGDTKYQ